MAERPRLLVSVKGRQESFDPSDTVRIGRSVGNQIVIDNEVVSSQHLRLSFDGTTWRAVDAGSSNGTFVNGQRVSNQVVDGPITFFLGGAARGAEVSFNISLPTMAIPVPPDIKAPVAGGGAGGAAAAARPATPNMTRRTEFYDGPKLGTTVLVGRGDERPDGRRNNIVLTDLGCSRAHAELRQQSDGTLLLLDSGSSNGTFVEGRRVSSHQLREGERVSMGAHQLRLVGGQLVVEALSSDVTFSVEQLVVEGKNADRSTKILLDHVSFSLPPKSLMAVLGPSGCGKSTLIKAISRTIGSTGGRVLFDGNDLFAHFDEFRRNIGYVPQDDIVHPSLTPERALAYAAELRFPKDVSKADRTARVDEVLRELGLDAHRNTVISKLSGGQRKRVSVALELLTRPSVLLLDEPTSGLDPGYEKSVMEMLRQLADNGQTVLVVTHAMQTLEVCDRVLVLAPGGKTAFFGPPNEMLPYFSAQSFADVFNQLEQNKGSDWAGKFAVSPQHRTYVGLPATGAARAHAARPKAVRPPQPRISQLWTLLRRYVAVLTSDRRNLLALVLQAPVIGIMLGLISQRGLRLNNTLPNGRSMLALLSLVIAGTYLGASNSVREIVKELPIFERERAVGLSITSYVASKALVLGTITFVHASILVVLATLFADGPTAGVMMPSAPLVELILTITLTGLAAMGIGLLVSAIVTNADKAMTALPVILLAMYLLSGGPSDPTNTPVLSQVSMLNSARWGLSASASSVDLPSLNKCDGQARGPEARQYEAKTTADGEPLEAAEIPPRKEWDDRCKRLWAHEPRVWWGSMTALGTILAATLTGAAVQLDSKQRRRASR